MPEPVNLAYAMRLAPADAIAYFQSKGYAITWNWGEARDEAHARAFTVAKAARLDILQDFREGLQQVLEEGLTEREWLQMMEPKLRAKGWWGKQVIVDSQGGAEVVQLGSPHRLRTIYRTNKFSAYQAGRYRRQKAAAEARPYWQYIAIMDARTRPSHAALHGQVFRHDDPIWESIYPPNGFNCRCRVRTLSQARLDAEGLTVQSSAGRASEEMVDAGLDKRTGEIYQKPVTVVRAKGRDGRDVEFRTDPGFNVNPGRASLWDAGGSLPDLEIGARPRGQRATAVRRQTSWQDLGLVRIRDLPESAWKAVPGLAQSQPTTEAAWRLILQEVGLADRIVTTVQTPIGRQVLHQDQFLHIARSGGNRERLAPLILPLLTDPFEIWAVNYGDHTRLRYLGLYKDAKGRPLLAATRENTDGSFWVWTLMQKDPNGLDSQREGVLLWPPRN